MSLEPCGARINGEVRLPIGETCPINNACVEFVGYPRRNGKRWRNKWRLPDDPRVGLLDGLANRLQETGCRCSVDHAMVKGQT